MYIRGLLPIVLLFVRGHGSTISELPRAVPNSNRTSAGKVARGILEIALDAKLAMWHPDGDSLAGIPVEAFAELGYPPQVPGPLIRVPAGTEVRATVRNSLAQDTLTFFLPKSRAQDPRAATDSAVIPPGESREFRATLPPGTYLYRAATNTRLGRVLGLGGLLAGAFVVDSVAAPAVPHDRVFVMTMAVDSVDATGFPVPARSVFAINGRSWPHTERLTATQGDTVHWRVVNASKDAHPMHLHGFYYRVDAFGGPLVAMQGQGPLPRMVVTERMTPYSTMSLTWVPERAGNWLFHCHFQEHIALHGAIGVPGPSANAPRIAPPGERQDASDHGSHATTGMGGLVLGVVVAPRVGSRIAEPGPGRRHLRLIAIEDPGFPDSVPSMRFALDEQSTLSRSPTIVLIRGEAVSITVVNQLREPTTVHWHGIEVESYFDGVGGFAGFGSRTAPVIAPRDSFVARFTPPRAGTFMYHSHVNEPRQHRAGLVGALIVRDSETIDAAEDVIYVLKTARMGGLLPIEVNGRVDPDTTVLRVGNRYRFRFINMTIRAVAATVWITARPDSAFARPRGDTLVAPWRMWAKDGADLPESARAPRRAPQIISMGETYDFEFVPQGRGHLRIEVRSPVLDERLFARIPIRVE
jgi:FtsP/CotA-like multicopper oxidase with cupredoxin domain